MTRRRVRLTRGTYHSNVRQGGRRRLPYLCSEGRRTRAAEPTESPLAQDNDGSGSVNNGGGRDEDKGGGGMRLQLSVVVVDVVMRGKEGVMAGDDRSERSTK